MWATWIAHDLLEPNRLHSEARPRADISMPEELRKVDEGMVAEARREKERRT